MRIKHVDEVISNARIIGEQLMCYNFPQADPRLEDDLNILKTKEVLVDGYSVILHYSKADYRTYYLETLQILGKNSPFLPFHLVVKIARKFLGNQKLTLVEPMRDNRKIYCWTVTLDRRGIAIDSPNQPPVEAQSYDGFKYTYLDAQHINFY